MRVITALQGLTSAEKSHEKVQLGKCIQAVSMSTYGKFSVVIIKPDKLKKEEIAENSAPTNVVTLFGDDP